MRKLMVAVETHRHKCIGSVVRCASAFGATMVAVVGNIDFSTHGAHGAQLHTQFIHFFYWSELSQWCDENEYDIMGLTNTVLNNFDEKYTSQSIDSFTFNRSACLIVGDKDGLNKEQLALSRVLLHVEIPNGEWLIPFDTKLAICLQQFAVQAGFQNSQHTGEKHHLNTITRKLGIIRGSRLVSKSDPNMSIDNADNGVDLSCLFACEETD